MKTPMETPVNIPTQTRCILAKRKRGDRIARSLLIVVATCVFSVMAADAETIEVVKSGQTDLLSPVHVDVNENGGFDGLSDKDLQSFSDGDALVLSSPKRNPTDAFLLRINFGTQFKLRARMAIDQAHHSAAGIFFFGRRNEKEQMARFMFNSNQGMLWVWGALFDQCLQELREKTAPQVVSDGQWFDLEIEVYPGVREGSSHFVLRLNGEELVNTVASSGLVQKIGFAPARAVLKIQDLSVEGDATLSTEN